VDGMSDLEKLEESILAHLKKVKKAGVGDIIANCLAGSGNTHPEMYQVLRKLREGKKLNWSIKEDKYLFVEKKKHVADNKRKTTKP
jgi:hypothetical protein